MMLIFVVYPWTAESEVIQLINVSTETKADLLPNYTNEELTDIQDIKTLLVNFIKGTNVSRQEVLSPKYRSRFKDVQRELSSAFNKEAYSKLDIRRLEYLSDSSATVKINLYWEDEGYSGVQTFHFIFAKEKKRWLIDWLVY
jgi:hypothetical protein